MKKRIIEILKNNAVEVEEYKHGFIAQAVLDDAFEAVADKIIKVINKKQHK